MMRLRHYHLMIAGGVVAITVLQLLRRGAPTAPQPALDSVLQSVGFLSCMGGTLLASRPLRAAYLALGSKRAARADPAYMAERRSVRIATLIAAAASSTLVASFVGVNPVVMAGAITLLCLIIIPVADRLSGWR